MRFILIFVIVVSIFSINNVEGATITITDDANVQQYFPNNNYGSTGSLRVQTKAAQNQNTWIKLDFSTILTEVGSASLKMYETTTLYATQTWELREGTSFTEGSVTWNNQPDYNGTVIDDYVVSGTESPSFWISWDITDFVNANLGTVKYVVIRNSILSQSTLRDMLFESAEAASNKPYIDYTSIPINNTVNFNPDLAKTNQTAMYVDSSAEVGSTVYITVNSTHRSCEIDIETLQYVNCTSREIPIPEMSGSWVHDEIEISENIQGYLEVANNSHHLIGSWIELSNYSYLYETIFYNVSLYNSSGVFLDSDSLQYSPFYDENEYNDPLNNTQVPNWSEPDDIPPIDDNFSFPERHDSSNTTINTTGTENYTVYVNDTLGGLNNTISDIEGISNGLFTGLNSEIQSINTLLVAQNNTKSIQIVCSYSCIFNSIPSKLQLVMILDLCLTGFLIIMRH